MTSYLPRTFAEARTAAAHLAASCAFLAAGFAVIPPPFVSPAYAADAAFSDEQKKAIGEIVKDYLTKNPEIIVEVQSPPRAVAKWLLRLPDPPGYSIATVKIGDEEMKRDADGRIDLRGRSGRFEVKFAVKPRD